MTKVFQALMAIEMAHKGKPREHADYLISPAEEDLKNRVEIKDAYYYNPNSDMQFEVVLDCNYTIWKPFITDKVDFSNSLFRDHYNFETEEFTVNAKLKVLIQIPQHMVGGLQDDKNCTYEEDMKFQQEFHNLVSTKCTQAIKQNFQSWSEVLDQCYGKIPTIR